MKKNLRNAALITLAGALVFGSVFSSYAATKGNGQWFMTNNRWWFGLNATGTTYATGGTWIKGMDGSINYYVFDENGWLRTGTTIDGDNYNSDGRWVDASGTVQQGTETNEYYTAVDFNALQTSASSSSTSAASSEFAAAAMANAAYASAQSRAFRGSTTQASTTVNSNTRYKGSTRGDNPANATYEQGYQSSSLSGTTAVNSWAGFSITLPSAPTIETSGDGTDWYLNDEDAGFMSCSYYPITKFGSGDLSSFINGLVSPTSRQFYGGSLTGTATFGSLSFYQLTRQDASPVGVFNDYCYVRQVPGTDYVQVIIIDNANLNDTLNNAMSTVG